MRSGHTPPGPSEISIEPDENNTPRGASCHGHTLALTITVANVIQSVNCFCLGGKIQT